MVANKKGGGVGVGEEGVNAMSVSGIHSILCSALYISFSLSTLKRLLRRMHIRRQNVDVPPVSIRNAIQVYI